MRFTLQPKDNIYNLMRQCGYAFEKPAYVPLSRTRAGKEENGELAFSRPLGTSRSGYPRFHIYLKINVVSREAVINLHLDQKKPIYQGVIAHAGEYQGKILEKEAERIKKIITGP